MSLWNARIGGIQDESRLHICHWCCSSASGIFIDIIVSTFSKRGGGSDLKKFVEGRSMVSKTRVQPPTSPPESIGIVFCGGDELVSIGAKGLLEDRQSRSRRIRDS
jgi:hypothetical protein